MLKLITAAMLVCFSLV